MDPGDDVGGVTPPPEEPPEQPPDDPEAQIEWCEAWIEWLQYNGWWKYLGNSNYVTLAAMREWRESVELQLVSYDWDYFRQEGGDLLMLAGLPAGMAVASWGGLGDELAAPYIGAPANVLGDPDCPGCGYVNGPTPHGNSKASMKPQHGYEIYRIESGDVVKTGINGQALNKNGTSPRANRQVNALNVAAGNTTCAARVVITRMLGRRNALEWERENALRLWEAGNSMEIHKYPRPWVE
jgi:hypothetical protein